MNHIIVTLDGPAGVGKSSLAREIAGDLAIPFLDTGAMFRFLALQLGPGLDLLAPEELAEQARAWRFSLRGAGTGTELLANGRQLGDDIRSEAASLAASRLGQRPEAREILKAAQRAIGRDSSLVAEGRDLGTVVFPYAPYKFFLDAHPEVRAMRRLRQLKLQGREAVYETILADIVARDTTDRNRSAAPLMPAADAITIDTSDMNIGEVKEAILRHIRG